MIKLKKNFNVDLLEITYEHSELDLEMLRTCEDKKHVNFGTVQMRRLPSTGYEFNYDVTVDGKRLGTFFFGTKNPNRPHYYLKVENEVFYGGMALIYQFENELLLRFRCISKLDICLDTNRNVVSRFYHLLKDRDQRIIIKNKEVKDRNVTIDSLLNMSVGSLDNIAKKRSFVIKADDALELKGYDKDYEISHSQKEYIRKYLRFDKHIYRLEVSFSTHRQVVDQLKYCKKPITEQMLHDNLDDKEILEEIFRRAFRRLIRLKKGDILEYLLSPTPRRGKKTSRPYSN